MKIVWFKKLHTNADRSVPQIRSEVDLFVAIATITLFICPTAFSSFRSVPCIQTTNRPSLCTPLQSSGAKTQTNWCLVVDWTLFPTPLPPILARRNHHGLHSCWSWPLSAERFGCSAATAHSSSQTQKHPKREMSAHSRSPQEKRENRRKSNLSGAKSNSVCLSACVWHWPFKILRANIGNVCCGGDRWSSLDRKSIRPSVGLKSISDTSATTTNFYLALIAFGVCVCVCLYMCRPSSSCPVDFSKKAYTHVHTQAGLQSEWEAVLKKERERERSEACTNFVVQIRMNRFESTRLLNCFSNMCVVLNPDFWWTHKHSSDERTSFGKCFAATWNVVATGKSAEKQSKSRKKLDFLK